MKKTLEQIMIENSKVFKQKEDEHGGHAFTQYSEVLKALFQKSISVGKNSNFDMNQFGVINMMIHKLIRICNSFSEGKSDFDSARDMSCYAVILESLYDGDCKDDNCN